MGSFALSSGLASSVSDMMTVGGAMVVWVAWVCGMSLGYFLRGVDRSF